MVPSLRFVGEGAARGAPLLGSEVRLLDGLGREVPITRQLEGNRVRLVPQQDLAPHTRYRIQRLHWWTPDGRRIADLDRLLDRWYPRQGSQREVIGNWSDAASFTTGAGRPNEPLEVAITHLDVEMHGGVFEDSCSTRSSARYTIALQRPLAPWEWLDLVQRGRGVLDSTWSTALTVEGALSDGSCSDDVSLPTDRVLLFEARVGGRRTEVSSAVVEVRTPPNGDPEMGFEPIRRSDLPAPPEGLPEWAPPTEGACPLSVSEPKPSKAPAGAESRHAGTDRAAVAARDPRGVVIRLLDRATGETVASHALPVHEVALAPAPAGGFWVAMAGAAGPRRDEFGILLDPAPPYPGAGCGPGFTAAHLTDTGDLKCAGPALPNVSASDSRYRGLSVAFIRDRPVYTWDDGGTVWVGADRAQVIGEPGEAPEVHCAESACLVTWWDPFQVLYAASWQPSGVSAPIAVDRTHSADVVVAWERGRWILWTVSPGAAPVWTVREVTCGSEPSPALPWSR